MQMTREIINQMMSCCTLCPRKCRADRLGGSYGFCGQGADIMAARAALHFWEEPCISGSQGSGTVFFSGCSLQCVFCQNHSIALGHAGMHITIDHLSTIFLSLQEKGAANINLVTACHFVPQVCRALELAKRQGLHIPVVYNTGSYEEVSTLRLLDGLADIYLPDLKYHSPLLSAKYSRADNYFEKAASAIDEMVRQTGRPVIDAPSGLMKKGVIVRHLLLPGEAGDSKRILRYLHDTYGNDIYVSIMNQYTPMKQVSHIPSLNRPVTDQEYRRILDFADKIGIEQGFLQEGACADESFIPPFDGEGLG
ncbi:MAG: radical SAM protein [Acetatifactor sp.]|nr:radical SAM protein [Acetatifactor sp.]